MKYQVQAFYKTSVTMDGEFDTLDEAIKAAETFAAAMGLRASDTLYYWSSEHHCVGVYAGDRAYPVYR